MRKKSQNFKYYSSLSIHKEEEEEGREKLDDSFQRSHRKMQKQKKKKSNLQYNTLHVLRDFLAPAATAASAAAAAAAAAAAGTRFTAPGFSLGNKNLQSS